MGCYLAAQGGDGMWIMPFGPDRQRLVAWRLVAVAVGEVVCRLRGADASVVRGKKDTALPPEIRKRRYIALRGDETRASSVPHSVPARVPASVLRSRARCASAA